MSTSITTIGLIPIRRLKRRWVRWTRQFGPEGTHVVVSSYSPAHTARAAAILRELGTPLLIHQPWYSMFNRWIEPELLGVVEREGVGCIAFAGLAQGLLTDRYLHGVPADSRAAQGKSLDPNSISGENLARVRALNEIAKGRGQTLAQMALAWVLRDPRMASTLVGASSVKQLEDNVAAVQRLEFSSDELAEIDRYAVESGVDCGPKRGRRRLFRQHFDLAHAACSTACPRYPGGR
jgi:L-glyceraldehyde 3-phosphate reductase